MSEITSSETWVSMTSETCPDILFSREPDGKYLYQCGTVALVHTGNELNIIGHALITPHEAEQLLNILYLMAREHNLCPLPYCINSNEELNGN